MERCTKCPLHLTSKIQVSDEGCSPNRMLVTGEAPGQHEEILGRPFVGRSGQLLTKGLESIGFKRPLEPYITNCCICRPPDNRKPTKDELLACKPRLMDTIINVNPDVILLVGATAMYNLLGIDDPITTVRGKWIDWEGPLRTHRVMVVFHPAYLLRHASTEVGTPKWLTWQDLLQVKAYLDLIQYPNHI